MAERFIKLQSFPENLYTDMAPVVIVAGNLLKDNQLSRILAQLKIQNIDRRTITEMTLQFRLLDANGKILDDAYVSEIEHTQIAENDFYITKNPVVISNANTASCSIKITQVKFADGTAWNSGNNWTPLDATTNIGDLKENRDRKVSEAARKKEKEEYEARMREEKYRVEKAKETKKKFTKIASIVACIAIVIACVVPVVNHKREENRRIAEQKAREGIVNALAGTTWKKTAEYVYKDGDVSTSESLLTFVNQTTYKHEDYSGTMWELKLNSLDSVYVIIYRTNDKEFYDSYEITFTENNGNYEVDFVDYAGKPIREMKAVSYTWERVS